MAEYIEKEAAMLTAMDYEGRGNAQDASMDIASAIGDIPAADVRENVKGEWIVVSGKCGKNIDGRTVKCPRCGNFLYMGGVNGGRGDANFCPNCGAQMEVLDG